MKEKAFSTQGLFLWLRCKWFLLQSGQSLARKPGWICRGILSRKKSFQPCQLTVQLKGKMQSCSIPPLRTILQLWFLGGSYVTINKVKEALRLLQCNTVGQSGQPCNLALPSVVSLARSRQTDRRADWGRWIPRTSPKLLLCRHLVSSELTSPFPCHVILSLWSSYLGGNGFYCKVKR